MPRALSNRGDWLVCRAYLCQALARLHRDPSKTPASCLAPPSTPTAHAVHRGGQHEGRFENASPLYSPRSDSIQGTVGNFASNWLAMTETETGPGAHDPGNAIGFGPAQTRQHIPTAYLRDLACPAKSGSPLRTPRDGCGVVMTHHAVTYAVPLAIRQFPPPRQARDPGPTRKRRLRPPHYGSSVPAETETNNAGR